MTTAEAYSACREIARREAKNFYYAFLALPRHKRDAICAVYAFMRQADDLSDDESISLENRRAKLDAWVAAWHAVAQGGLTSDPVFIALADAQRSFGIPSSLLDQLVEGTAMDLQRAGTHSGVSEAYDTYATFNDLYSYCYLVASVVGLVCIRIFGYSDTRAEKLAEETGIAFQLTNILRDVREDVDRKRVYLPLDEMDQHRVAIGDLAAHPAPLAANERELLAALAARAEHYYRSGFELLPLIDQDSRSALWVLISIYHRLLNRIERSQYEVFAQRIAVPTAAKLAILTRGFMRTLLVRTGAGKS